MEHICTCVEKAAAIDTTVNMLRLKILNNKEFVNNMHTESLRKRSTDVGLSLNSDKFWRLLEPLHSFLQTLTRLSWKDLHLYVLLMRLLY